MASSLRGYPIRALMDRDLHDGSAVYPSVLSRIGGSPSFRFHALSPPPPKTETWPISTTVAPFYCPRCLSLVREIKHDERRGKKERKRRKKKNNLFEQLLTTIASSRRWIVIRNEGKQVPPRLLDRRELPAAIRAIQLGRVSFEARRVSEDWTVARIDSDPSSICTRDTEWNLI